PYDVLRLRRKTGLKSFELLEKYIITEKGEEDIFPHFYLTMVDDGRASCVFVNRNGCTIYQDRPAACRTYPMGRAVTREKGRLDVFFVLLHEAHCHGFTEHTIQTVESFNRSQGLEPYNRFNDMLTSITQHEKIRQGMRLSDQQLLSYSLALYDIDTFRSALEKGAIPGADDIPGTDFTDDEALLVYGMKWLKRALFAS
ncbi:MAG: YkgJ family cysteine cluster protein, partial [Desulfobacterales bacterium]|nr:YkgJ family cysteine cluster protein [Desulfobacterales bacterium]